MCYNKAVHVQTKPRHQRGQRSLHSGQPLFTLAKKLQLCAESVSLGLDIISQLALVDVSNVNKLLLYCSTLFCIMICINNYRPERRLLP